MRKWLALLLAFLMTVLPALAETADPSAAPEVTASAAPTEGTEPSAIAPDATWAVPGAEETSADEPAAEETPAVVEIMSLEETKVSVPGAFAARTATDIFAAIPDGEQTALVRVARTGGDPVLVERADKIEQIVVLGTDIFYLRTQGEVVTLGRCDENGTVTTVYTFEKDANPHGLSAFDGDLYLLLNDQLHVIYPANGLCLKLVGTRMSEFVIAGEYAYFVSLSDVLTYETDSLLGEGTLSAQGGCLYRLNMETGNDSLLIKTGVDTIKYAGGKLYFHNLSDDYVMGGADNEWMEGHLYSFDLGLQQLESVLSDYDWGFFPAAAGVAVYTASEITLHADGKKTPLYVPEGYLDIAADETGLIAYEQTSGKLMLIGFDGAVLAATDGDMTALASADPTAEVSPDASVAPDATPSTDWNEVLADANSAAGSGNSGSAGSNAGASGNSGFGSGSSSTSKPDSSSSSGSGSSSTSKPSATSKPTATKKPTATVKPTATTKPSSGATDSSYIFKNSSKKKLTREQILKVDKSLWPYARNEIFARHGYEFSESKYKKYFSKKTWYKPGGFSTGDLNSTEWYNMDLLKAMEKEYASGSGSSGSGSSSGATDSSYIFKNSSTKKLTREQILKVDQSLWPYARNEIFARHGYEFTNSKFKKYFSKKSWYKPGGFSNSDLNSIEWYNMDLLKKMEKEYK